MKNSFMLGGFDGVFDPREDPQDTAIDRVPVFRTSVLGERPEAVCQFSRNGVEGVFWGELYGSSLPRGSQDAGDLVVSGYLEHGDDFAGRIDGIFAFALWDQRERRFLLYRDGSGARNLYYHRDSLGRLHFSTQLATLVRQVRPSLDRAGVYEYLRFFEVVPPNTLYENVRALEAGCRLTLQAGCLDINPVPSSCDVFPEARDFESAVTQLDVLLQEAVQARMSGPESVGAFLSGGVDSALICALARKVGRPPAGVVTVGFTEANYDESGLAAAIAAHLEIPHRVLRFSKEDYQQAFDRLYACCDQPSADPAGLSTLLAFEFCAGQYDAMLDGSGAEALVGVMPARYTRVAIQYAARIPVAARKLLAAMLKPWPRIGSYARLFDFGDAEELLMRWRGFSRRELEEIFGEPVSFSGTRFYRVFREYPPSAHFERFTALLGVLTDDRIHNAATLSGLPVRLPFLDRRVEAYVRTLPCEWRSTEAMEKRILRTLLGRHLPPALWDVPKHGFDFPLQAFMKANERALVNRYLDSVGSPLLAIFERAMLHAYAEKFRAGDPVALFRAWALVVLARWLESR